MFETIVALATPPLKSALSIVRLSGDDCIDVVNKFFSKDLPHTTNPKLNIINEDNYKNIKCSLIDSEGNINYSNIKIEFLNGSFFNSELLTTENKLNNYYQLFYHLDSHRHILLYQVQVAFLY